MDSLFVIVWPNIGKWDFLIASNDHFTLFI